MSKGYQGMLAQLLNKDNHCLLNLQAGREMAHLQGSSLGCSQPASSPSAAAGADGLPVLAPWQRQILEQLQLAGPRAKLEVAVGASAQPVDARLLAATRALYAETAAPVQGLSMRKLGAWGSPVLGAAVEVRTPLLSSLMHALVFAKWALVLHSGKLAAGAPMARAAQLVGL